MKFLIEHSDDPLTSRDIFERLSSGCDTGRKTISEWYMVYEDLYYRQPEKALKIPKLKMSDISGFKTKRGMRKIKSNSVKNSF